MNLLPPGRHFLLCSIALFSLPSAAQEYVQAPEPMPVHGRITDGDKKLVGAEVAVYKGNEEVDMVQTDKGGRFHLRLLMNEVYALEFRQEGFVAKRIAIDTHLPERKGGETFDIAPLDITVSLLEKARYEGAPTDDLDFPFALIRFNKKTLAFEPDQEYTMGMQRTNGALLLMAARSEKQEER